MSDPVTAQFAQLISTITIENVPVAAAEQIRWRVLKAFATILSADINQRKTISRVTATTGPGTSTRSGSQAALGSTGYAQHQPVLSALSTGAILDIRQPGAQMHAGPHDSRFCHHCCGLVACPGQSGQRTPIHERVGCRISCNRGTGQSA